jgi:hypothetical protein
MKFLKEYFYFISENKQMNGEKEIPLRESTSQLKNFVENLKKKLEYKGFLVIDFPGVTLDELIDEKDDQTIPEFVIFKYYSQEYEKRTKSDGGVSLGNRIRYFLRVYLLSENEDKFLEILNFNNDDYPGVEWIQNNNPQNVQYPSREESYKPHLFSKRKTKTVRGKSKEVLQFEFSTGDKLNLSDDSGIKGSKYATDEVRFAQEFYLKNLIKKLQKNQKFGKYIGDDGSVSGIPGCVNKNNTPVGFSVRPYENLFRYKDLVEICKDEYFLEYECIPLTEFYLELFNILSLNQNIDPRGVYINLISRNLFEISVEPKSCPQYEQCGNLNDKFSSKKNPKNIWQDLLFEKLSNGIPHEKAKKIYDKYSKNPDVYVDPVELFKFKPNQQ